MRLLVSVAGPADVAAALDGGADVIDAKDPTRGALGAVSLDVFREIVAAVNGRRPVTAALGDAADEISVERAAREFRAAGASLVKIGFAGVADPARAVTLARAAVRGAGASCGVVVVAYADAAPGQSLDRARLIDVAREAGARGVLVDTADKRGPGLLELVEPDVLGRWVREARDAGLVVALAGRLRADDLPVVRDAGADVAGVRGAACAGGRAGRVDADRVRRLKGLCEARSAIAVGVDGGFDQPRMLGRHDGVADAGR